MRKLVASLAIGAVAIAGSFLVGAGADASTCVHGSWPSDVQGRPSTLQSGAATGLYVWQTSNGWELAVTHDASSKMIFTGSVRTDGQLYGAERRTERRDHVLFSEDANGVHYRFTNYGHIDGLVFRTRCANRLVFNGKIDGVALTVNQIFIGADGHHPGGVPFVISRG